MTATPAYMGPTTSAPVKKTAGNLKGPGPGRPKGVPNKITQVAKDAIAQAAADLGGAERLVAWAREDPKNEHSFWATIYPKLLPLQVSGDPENPVGITFQTIYEAKK